MQRAAGLRPLTFIPDPEGCHTGNFSPVLLASSLNGGAQVLSLHYGRYQQRFFPSLNVHNLFSVLDRTIDFSMQSNKKVSYAQVEDFLTHDVRYSILRDLVTV